VSKGVGRGRWLGNKGKNYYYYYYYYYYYVLTATTTTTRLVSSLLPRDHTPSVYSMTPIC